MFKRVNSDVVPFSINSPAGNRYTFGTTDVSNDIDVNYNENIKKGFGTGPNEFPELEDFNALMFTESYLAAYLYQAGIPEWNDKQKYYINSIAMGSDGNIYKSLTGTEETPNVDNNPTLAGSVSWKSILSDYALFNPTITGTATLSGTTNNTVQLTDIVTTLGLEVGDVIRIQYSGYNKLHTVESITNNDLIIVNYEHARNRGNGSLKLADTTTTVTITRIAKWYNAPIGLGQAWVDVLSFRLYGTSYTNTTRRQIAASISVAGTAVETGRAMSIVVGGVQIYFSPAYSAISVCSISNVVIPAGQAYALAVGGFTAINAISAWKELR